MGEMTRSVSEIDMQAPVVGGVRDRDRRRSRSGLGRAGGDRSVAELEPGGQVVAVDGAIEEGSTFRWKAGPGTITSTIEDLERPRRMAWTGRSFGLRATHVHTFEPRDGATVVTTRESYEGLVARVFERRLQATLDSRFRCAPSPEGRSRAAGSTGDRVHVSEPRSRHRGPFAARVEEPPRRVARRPRLRLRRARRLAACRRRAPRSDGRAARAAGRRPAGSVRRRGHHRRPDSLAVPVSLGFGCRSRSSSGFLLVLALDAALLWFAADAVADSITIDSFGWAFVGALAAAAATLVVPDRASASTTTT